MTSVSGSFAERDPVVDALADIAKWGREFNKTQPRLQIEYRTEALQKPLLKARIREREIATYLVATLSKSGRSVGLRPARRLEVSLGRPVKYGPNSMWGPTLSWREVRSPSGHEEVSVDWAAEDDGFDLFDQGKGDEQPISSGGGEVTGAIAGWLGFSHEDVRLVGAVIHPWDDTQS